MKKKTMSLILTLVMCFTLCIPALAMESLSVSNESDVLTLCKLENGDFGGSIRIESRDARGIIQVTDVYAVLHGNVAGVANKYVLDIAWAGDMHVGSMRADQISIVNASALSSATYYSDSFKVSCGGATAGSRSAGVFNIPVNVTKVKVKSDNFQTYFLETESWLSKGNFWGTYSVN